MNQVVRLPLRERHYQIYCASPQDSEIHPLYPHPKQQNLATFKHSKTAFNTSKHG